MSFVRDLCNEYRIPLQVFKEDITAFADENGYSIEEAGRIIRYKRLKEVLDKECHSYCCCTSQG